MKTQGTLLKVKTVVKVRIKSTNIPASCFVCVTLDNTLIVSSASSITAHCLGVRAFASSRPMCSCRMDRKKESVHTTVTAKIYTFVRYVVAAFYFHHLEFGQLAQLLGSVEDHLGALSRRDGQTSGYSVDRKTRVVFERCVAGDDLQSER